ncbi:MAG: aminotransferase class I/II-fold pyridoxal phosphate-dependent enzyme [Bacillota bacterium]
MNDFANMDRNRLAALRGELQQAYNTFKTKNLKLNLQRGIPCPEQLELAAELMECLPRHDYKAADGTDCRNYGKVDGLPEAKELFARCLNVLPGEIIVGGNSSLAFMHDIVVKAMLCGLPESDKPWCKLPAVKFLCPCPGYDRHFAICAHLGIGMVNIDLKSGGPDMDRIESLVAKDGTVKGIWCTPKYSNPTGLVYSDEVVERLARMRTKAKDFRIFWDDAYTMHHLTDSPDNLKNILQACKDAGNPDRVFIFASTSKVSFAGAGVAMTAGSENNMDWLRKQLTVQTIGPDKLNQLRHVRFYKNLDGIAAHMKKHAAIIKPKFDLVSEIFEKELGNKNIATWSKPNGGYFISLNTPEGCAKKVVSMAAEAGVSLTPAGATYPYGKDPRDSNIRIAPTFPPLSELRQAMELVVICVQLAAIEKILR